MYNNNKYFYYTRRCISHDTKRCIIKIFVVIIRLHVQQIFLLYMQTYNDNKYFYHTKRRIMKYFIAQEDV